MAKRIVDARSLDYKDLSPGEKLLVDALIKYLGQHEVDMSIPRELGEWPSKSIERANWIGSPGKDSGEARILRG